VETEKGGRVYPRSGAKGTTGRGKKGRPDTMKNEKERSQEGKRGLPVTKKSKKGHFGGRRAPDKEREFKKVEIYGSKKGQQLINNLKKTVRRSECSKKERGGGNGFYRSRGEKPLPKRKKKRRVCSRQQRGGALSHRFLNANLREKNHRPDSRFVLFKYEKQFKPSTWGGEEIKKEGGGGCITKLQWVSKSRGGGGLQYS